MSEIKIVDLEKPMHFTKEQSEWIKAYVIVKKQEARADAIDDVERELLASGFIFTEHALEVWHGISDKLKEQK